MRPTTTCRARSAGTRRSDAARRRAFSSIYVGLMLVPLAGFASLSIDMGRVRLARANLQAGADAAARAGASGLPVSVAATQSRATALATANTCLSVPIGFSAATDLEFGIWSKASRTFTPLPNSSLPPTNPARAANAVRVTTYRTAARNGPVPLTIAAAVGVTQAEVATQAVAMISGGPIRFGIVALNHYDANGNKASIDSYDPAAGPYPGYPANANGDLVSNGDIDLGNGDVYGDVRAGIDKRIIQGPTSVITGWHANLDQVLAYSAVKVPKGAAPIVLDKGKTYSIGGGGTAGKPAVYTTVNLSGSLSVQGVTVLYVTGSVDLKGAQVVGNLPANLTVYVVGSGAVSLGGQSELYAHVYAPQSDVYLAGGPDLYGWIVGKTISLKGDSKIHYDESVSKVAPYQIALVK